MQSAEALLQAIRGKGWSVAAHNDYKVGSVTFTFWLFTKDIFYAKGEGTTDQMALLEASMRIKKVEKFSELLGPSWVPEDL